MMYIEPDNFEPSTGRVDIWRLPLDSSRETLRHCINCLNQAERNRADTLRIAHRRTQFILVRACLRQILARITQNTAARIRLFHTRRGKPYIKAPFQGEQIHFNLSHSSEQALIALTLGQALGIDIEKMAMNRDYRGLSRRFFSAREQARLNGFEQDSLCNAFYACWTRKEAFIKATGAGMACGLDKFDVSVRVGTGLSQIYLHPTTGIYATWFNRSLACEPGYVAALALRDPAVRLRYRTVRWLND